METRRVRLGAATVHVAGSIPGYVPHGAAVEQLLEDLEPTTVALGIPPEDLDGLAQLANEPETELPDPEAPSARLLELLARFGPTRIPSPDLDAAYRWCDQNQITMEALDMDDEEHAELYIRHNRFFDVIKGNRLQKRLLTTSFDDAQDEDDLVRRFDAMQTQLPSLAGVEREREEHMARRLRTVAAGQGLVVAVVPLARLDGIMAAWEAQAQKA